MKLTLDQLTMDYATWTLSFGQGRDMHDLRFGQYIHNKYDMAGIEADVFYEESVEAAFVTLIKELHEREEK
jgi:hypothetical protein